jgi:hypothetical protein
MYNEIVNKKDTLTDDELQGLYMYLSLHFEDMNKEEKLMWIELMKQLDKDFYDTE